MGRYKNAPNQFTGRGFTEPHREQMEALLDSLYGEYVSGIAKARGPADVQALVDGGPYDAASAKSRPGGRAAYRRPAARAALGRRGDQAGRYVKPSRGFDASPHRPLYAVGEIIAGESQTSPFCGSFRGVRPHRGRGPAGGAAQGIKASPAARGHPGGSGTASDVIWREVELARKSKPVVVSMGDVAASGGYYIAMGSDAIVAQPGTITGSIGVFGGKFSLRGLYDKIGLRRRS